MMDLYVLKSMDISEKVMVVGAAVALGVCLLLYYAMSESPLQGPLDDGPTTAEIVEVELP